MNEIAQPTALVHHERGTWLDPQTGETLAVRTLLDRLLHRQAVLLGETHDNAEIHRWQLNVIAMLHAHRQDIAVGFEMFPRRVQPALDAWVAGELDVDRFLLRSEWHRAWRFDPELYLPIFHFCRQNRIPMLALNCERDLVRQVGRLGWDGVPEAQRENLSRPAAATAAYRRYLFDITGGGRPDRKAKSADDPAFDSFVNAQQIWDRAFACNIVAWLQANPRSLVVGIIGRGHLDFGGGTPHQLRELGIAEPAVLCPSQAPEIDLGQVAGIGEAIFRLDDIEPRGGRVFDAGLTFVGESATIAAVAPESAAARAALVPGDRISSIGGQDTDDDAACVLGLLRRLPPGASVEILFQRDGIQHRTVLANAL